MMWVMWGICVTVWSFTTLMIVTYYYDWFSLEFLEELQEMK